MRKLLLCLVLANAFASPHDTAIAQELRMTDHEQLMKLNEDYISAVQYSDVKRFNEILSEDFLCSMPDATLLDRKAFLDYTAKPVMIRNLQAYDVKIRLMGDFAIIHAATSYTAVDGTTAGGRYTDVWARRNGKWLAVSAHVTRK